MAHKVWLKNVTFKWVIPRLEAILRHFYFWFENIFEKFFFFSFLKIASLKGRYFQTFCNHEISRFFLSNYSTSQNKPRQNIDGTWMEQVQSKCFSIVLIHFIWCDCIMLHFWRIFSYVPFFFCAVSIHVTSLFCLG